MTRRPLLLLAFLAAACNTGFEPQYRVTDLRILGVRSAVLDAAGRPQLSADVSSEDTVLLEALVANPRGRAAPRVRWYSCVPASLEGAPPCLEPEFLKDPAGLAAAYGVPQIAEGVAPVLTLPDVAPREAFSALLDAALDLAERERTFQCRLFVEVPIVVVAESEGVREVALKRVRLVPTSADLARHPGVRNDYQLNLNPDPARTAVVRAPQGEESCVRDEVAVPPFPSSRAVLCARADAPGPYGICDADGEPAAATESYSYQWYVTDGEFPEFDGRGNAVGSTVEFERPTAGFTMWFLVRDGRGGESWAIYRDP